MEEGGGVMDCNSYSYVNFDNDSTLIRRFEEDHHFVELTEEQDWFQDKFFTVRSDVEDDDGEWVYETFDYTLIPDTREAALAKAIDLFNKVVATIQKEVALC